MKIFLLLLFFAPSFIFAQEAPNIIEQIIKEKQDTSKIYYADLVFVYRTFETKVLNRRKIKAYFIPGPGGTTFVLQKSERNHIAAEFSKMKRSLWPKDLFPNSQRVANDSAWNYISDFLKKSNYRVHPEKGHQVWWFSKPIYLRNNTLCLISFRYMCHDLCGEDELAFYKRNERGRWERYVVIDGGAF